MDETNELEQQYATFDDLTIVDLPEEDYLLPSGKLLRIRALTRAESIRASKLEGDRAKQEQALLSMAVLRPKMTPDQVARWQASKAFMEVERVARAINKLSGVGADAAKSDLPDDGEPA